MASRWAACALPLSRLGDTLRRGAEMPRRNRAADPAALARFFDGPRGTAAARSAPARPRRSSRSLPEAIVATGRRPCGVSGARTIELRGVAPGGILGNAATETAAPGPSLEESTLASALCASGASAVRIARAGRCLARTVAPDGCGGAASTVVVMEDDRYENMGVRPPVLREVPLPEVVRDAGEQADRRLLHPRERRLLMELERDARKARGLAQRARRRRVRSDYLLQKAHPSGVVAVDSAANPATVAYRAQRDALAREAQRSARAAAARRERLAQLLQPARRHGYDPLRHAPGAARGRERLFPRRGGARPAVDTHGRLFGGRGAAPRPERRHRRNRDPLGRAYDILTGAPAGTVPSASAAREDS